MREFVKWDYGAAPGRSARDGRRPGPRHCVQPAGRPRLPDAPGRRHRRVAVPPDGRRVRPPSAVPSVPARARRATRGRSDHCGGSQPAGDHLVAGTGPGGTRGAGPACRPPGGCRWSRPGRPISNFPRDHPLHQGFRRRGPRRRGGRRSRDRIGTPRGFRPTPSRPATPSSFRSTTTRSIRPVRFGASRPTSAWPGHAGSTLRALAAELDRLALDESAIAARRRRWATAHERQREAWRTAGDAARDTTPLDYAWISKCLGDVLDAGDIVVTEIVVDPAQACFTRPGTYFNHSHAAVLGWGPGAALGARLAHPDRTVVCAVGDGSHVFGVPTATHHTAHACDLPVLFVVYNNAGWERTRRATLAHAPEGWGRPEPAAAAVRAGAAPGLRRDLQGERGVRRAGRRPGPAAGRAGAGARRRAARAAAGAARRHRRLTGIPDDRRRPRPHPRAHSGPDSHRSLT